MKSIKQNELLLKRAQEAIEAVFGDMNVSRERCRDNLKELADDIEGKLACLDADDEREQS